MTGEFLNLAGERYYAIHNVDEMPPFLISLVSNVDHWLFVSSTGGLTAGRVSPETALFPYVTVDKVHESGLHTGPRTLLRIKADGRHHHWEPFNREQDGAFATSRRLYKNLLGNRLCFEEINHDLDLEFRYTWSISETFGFVRQCELANNAGQTQSVEILDGLQNILPAGTPRFTQANSSNLVDAYKWTELDGETGLALYTLYSGITDRAEPCESLKANIAYCLGLDGAVTLVSSTQVASFRRGGKLREERHKRGIRGAFLVNQAVDLEPGSSQSWTIVTDVEQSQSDVVELKKQLAAPAELAVTVEDTVAKGSDDLAQIMAMSDGFQVAAEENVTVHHYANVLFNVLRGGFFPDQYNVTARDFGETIRHFNRGVYRRNAELLEGLPERLGYATLLRIVVEHGDSQLTRLCREYLPMTFGRRHGDPSRPWNQFAIRVKDRLGFRLFSYEGNWRDIFQNWEALAWSYPEFIENMIAKFVNASTMDGYNPYRITKDGIDWEVEDPEDPWSYIGYWGDHQIIYLQKLLEISRQFHPTRLGKLLHEPVFAYANVPYRIRPFADLLENPKNTVDYDDTLAKRIEDLVADIGADGKLVPDVAGEVHQVTLLEKLLVPLLCKLGNLVVGGGIWMNTQRPEWNDANNALVGQGLSMVTLCYLRRYLYFVDELIGTEHEVFELSSEVAEWLAESAGALGRFRPKLGQPEVSPAERLALLTELGEAASRYRDAVYRNGRMSGKGKCALDTVRALLADATAAVDHSIATNRREDGLYHAYNLLDRTADGIDIGTLYPMLEGQVAALSSGAMGAAEAVDVIESLFESNVYRPDQYSFMLYPDRELPAFLDKNRIPDIEVERIPLLGRLVAEGNEQIVLHDADGCYRFSAEFTNFGDLDAELDTLDDRYRADAEAAREPLRVLFEWVFDHQAFTGRSGTMFGFEGLGCVYWHMVSKLLLAVQENFFAALDGQRDGAAARQLGRLYYRIRAGIGFNKTPLEYGAFPTDPYSHTPGHSGVRQPGMTGQVKEEIITRFGELGVRVAEGIARFEPGLLRVQEFIDQPRQFCYFDVDGRWQDLTVPARGLTFTWCQVPVIYQLDDNVDPGLTVVYYDGTQNAVDRTALSASECASLFRREGRIRRLIVTFGTDALFPE